MVECTRLLHGAGDQRFNIFLMAAFYTIRPLYGCLCSSVMATPPVNHYTARWRIISPSRHRCPPPHLPHLFLFGTSLRLAEPTNPRFCMVYTSIVVGFKVKCAAGLLGQF